MRHSGIVYGSAEQQIQVKVKVWEPEKAPKSVLAGKAAESSSS